MFIAMRRRQQTAFVDVCLSEKRAKMLKQSKVFAAKLFHYNRHGNSGLIVETPHLYLEQCAIYSGLAPTMFYAFSNGTAFVLESAKVQAAHAAICDSNAAFV